MSVTLGDTISPSTPMITVKARGSGGRVLTLQMRKLGPCSFLHLSQREACSFLSKVDPSPVT